MPRAIWKHYLLEANVHTNTIITVYQSVHREGVRQGVSPGVKGIQRTKHHLPDPPHHLLPCSTASYHPGSLPIKPFTLTSPLPISMMCVCGTQACWNTAHPPDAPAAEAAAGGRGGALLLTFDLGRIDSSLGLWGHSPLTSEVFQSKPANHDSLWFTLWPSARRERGWAYRRVVWGVGGSSGGVTIKTYHPAVMEHML